MFESTFLQQFLWIAVSAVVCVFLVSKLLIEPRRRRKFQMEIVESSATVILERKISLGADEGIGLMNLSGIRASADESCGIFLFGDKILFESQSESLELPFDKLKKVYVDRQTDVTDYHKNVTRSRASFLPPNHSSTKKYHIDGNTVKEKIDPTFITEHTLVFEYEKEKATPSEYIVFAFSDKNQDEVNDFVTRCTERIS